MSKRYDAELSEVIKTRLTQLEAKPKPPSKVPARQIIEQFREIARQAMAKGYTLAEIREIAEEAGLEVSLSTLKTYQRKQRTKKKAPRGQLKAAVKPAQGEPDSDEAADKENA